MCFKLWSAMVRPELRCCIHASTSWCSREASTTGKRIAAAAAERLLPVVLELGGKDPMMVLDDADVDVASSAAVWGAFVNAGQACLSVERCYVHRSLYEAFVDGMCARRRSQLRVGNGMAADTDVGPMIHERQVRIVESHVEEAKARGARVLAGGERLPELGNEISMHRPLLRTYATRCDIMREETFGPVSADHAVCRRRRSVRLANDSEYGLAASVWTRDAKRGEQIARRIHAGTVMVNDVISCFGISEAPHGGVKASGVGRTHGRFGLDEMVRIKYVDIDRMPGIKKIWWYGYGESFRKQMEGFLDLQFGRGFGKRVSGALRAAGVLRRKQL